MMKQMLKMLCILLVLLAVCCAAAAEERPVFVLPAGQSQTEVHTQMIEDECWLFLPAFADMETLHVEGAQLEWWDTEPDEDGLWYVDVTQGEDVTEVTVMRSQNLRALFLFSDDPEQNREYIENCTDHERFTTASMALVDEQGVVNHTEKITNLRGRGNWTWNWPKKPYQIKLENRVDLLDTGDDSNRSRTWVLLAECLDSTLLHNRITADLARELGLNAMDSEFVDLYYDGDYRGTYLLSEKVEVGEGRIDVLDYEDLLKKWNKKAGQTDLDIASFSAADVQNTEADELADDRGPAGTGDAHAAGEDQQRIQGDVQHRAGDDAHHGVHDAALVAQLVVQYQRGGHPGGAQQDHPKVVLGLLDGGGGGAEKEGQWLQEEEAQA